MDLIIGRKLRYQIHLFHFDGCLIISQFSEVTVDFFQPFFQPFGFAADRIQQRFAYKLCSNHRIEEGVTVDGNRQENGCVFCQKGVGLVGDHNDGSADFFCHFSSNSIG